MTVSDKTNHSSDCNVDLQEAPEACVIDFFVARRRLQPESDIGAESYLTRKQMLDNAAQWRRAAEISGRVEDLVYSIISVALLIALLLGIACVLSEGRNRIHQPERPQPAEYVHGESSG